MDNCLEIHWFLKFNQEEIIWIFLYILKDVLTAISAKYLRNNTNFIKTLRDIEDEGAHFHLFYVYIFTLILNPVKDITRKVNNGNISITVQIWIPILNWFYLIILYWKYFHYSFWTKLQSNSVDKVWSFLQMMVV